VQKVQQVQKLDREQAKALVRERLAQRWEEMTPAERLRATKRALRIAARIQEKRSGYGYVDRERARARVRQRIENAR
jgi:hypothetical protein